MSTSRNLFYALAGVGLFLAFALGFALISGLIIVPSAYAQGRATLHTADSDLALAFTRAATDDPRRTIDPGQEMHVGRCTAQRAGDTAVSFAIFNGYPGYTCTLTLRLENRGEQSVQLQAIHYAVPGGLSLRGPDDLVGQVLPPGESIEQVFRLAVGAAAHEASEHPFSIEETFVTVEPPAASLAEGKQ